ncbi:hypothetical protein JCM31826_01010 [Thermaurantimonas aggregans]|uniref:Uncharacterized protein n=1 Tax=Thermaurantimonas aggregans TaxID=2173829 RepID=A0A401XHX8_9FLAO|nr:hypothetical protein JCM31826_01010 [Thermaurantimonas aggregans]
MNEDEINLNYYLKKLVVIELKFFKYLLLMTDYKNHHIFNNFYFLNECTYIKKATFLGGHWFLDLEN